MDDDKSYDSSDEKTVEAVTTGYISKQRTTKKVR